MEEEQKAEAEDKEQSKEIKMADLNASDTTVGQVPDADVEASATSSETDSESEIESSSSTENNTSALESQESSEMNVEYNIKVEKCPTDSQSDSLFENERTGSLENSESCSTSFLRDDSVVEFTISEVTRDCGQTEPECSNTEAKALGSVESEDDAVPEDSRNSSRILTDILKDRNLADFKISRVDFSSTSKENVMKMLGTLLEECDTLKKEKARLQNDVERLEADHSTDLYAKQIESLEKSLAQAQADACSWQQKVQQTEERYMEENVKIRSDLTSRLERVTKQYEAANKDKESMVIKYATSEREVIVAKQQKEAVEKKMREMEKEREQLLQKNKMLVGERVRICQTLDSKVQKNNWYQRESERLKEEISTRDIKIKWAQTKLKTEIEAHKETHAKLDRALIKITKHEDELRSIKEEAEKFVQNTKEDENSRANVLDMQLKEEKARLILERQANEDRGSAFSKVSMELESLRSKHSALVEEATTLRSKVATFEGEREETEKLFASLRMEVTNARQEAADLNLQLSNSAHLQQQLQREREQSSTANQEIDRLQSTNNELEGDLLACRQKEAELLAFTQKLTDKNVQIQSQFSALQSKTQLMELENGEMKTELNELKIQKAKMKSELVKENQAQNAQIENLTRQLTDKTEESKQLATKAMDLENEIQVLKRKHNNSQKDITREMQKLRKRLDAHENGSNGGNGSGSGGIVMSGRSSQSVTPHDSLSQGSRASSNTSLNTLEYQSTNGSSPQSQDPLPPLNDPLVTQQLLVDRIIRLQKAAAKRAEKIEFLEEHVSSLISEIKKKSRIIHHYIMKEEAGALSNNASDSSKAELMRHGGIMASVYGSAPRDGSMTIELSLEINRKLQAVLEDTLLKNITLKENLNTLGDEIAKMSRQNQELETRK